jgi:prevent-host-death family protein
MREINAARFKQQCLAILDSLPAEGIVITKRGKPVARIIPMESDCADLIGLFKGKLKIRGDVFTTGIRWDAES